MRAEILSYSRTRGLFAGLSLEGSVVKQDKDGNENVYGERVDPKRLLLEGKYARPGGGARPRRAPLARPRRAAPPDALETLPNSRSSPSDRSGT